MSFSIGDERSPSPVPNCQGRSAFSSSRLYCLNIQIEPNQPFHAKLPRWKQAKITSRPVKNGDNCVHGSRPRPIRRLRSQTTRPVKKSIQTNVTRLCRDVPPTRSTLSAWGDKGDAASCVPLDFPSQPCIPSPE